MNILYLPTNVASMPALTAVGVSKIKGVNVKVLTLGGNKFTSGNEFVISLCASKRKPIAWLIHVLTFKRKIKKLLEWADVVHYFWGPIFPDYADLELCYKLKKQFL